MRRAYSYWQDQPGSDFIRFFSLSSAGAFICSRPFLARSPGPGVVEHARLLFLLLDRLRSLAGFAHVWLPDARARHIGRVLSRLAASEQGLAEIWLAFFVSSSAGSEATIGAYLNASRTQRRSGENDTPGLPVSAPEISGSSMLIRGSLLRSPAPRKGPSDKGFCTELAPRRKNGYRFSPVGECHDRCFAVESRAYFGTDSGLEAFSRNPADGSFAPSARRPEHAPPIVRGRGSSRTERLYRFGSPFRQRVLVSYFDFVVDR